MLQKLNERIQGVIAWLVIILIVITFTLFGVDYYMQSHHTSDAKAIVNGIPLANQAFETNYRRARAQQELSQMTASDEKRIQEQVLDQMIANEVVVQSANKFGFGVTTEQANLAILKIPQFQEDGHFSAQKYQQALSGALFTPETFQKEVRQGMLLNQQRFAFVGSSFALPDEIERFVRLYLQTRNYDYLTIPAALFVKDAKISVKEIKKYYQDNQNEFMSPEKVSLDYILLSMHDIRSKIKISEEDLKRYYDENKNNFLTPSQWKVAHILFSVPENATESDDERIKKKADSAYQTLQKNPEQFDQLVQSLSDDKLSLADKGVLPLLTAGHSDYDKILSQLTTPGQISLPEKSKHGYEIFKLIEYKPALIKPLSEVKNTIQDQLTTEMAQNQYAHLLEQLTDLSYQTPDSLDSVSDLLKMPIQKSQLFSRAGGSTELTKNKLVINAAFSHDVLELNNNSEPVQLDNDSVVVVRVNQHIPSKVNSFESVQDQIKNILAIKTAQKKAKEVGSMLLNPVEAKNQKELIEKNHFQWHSVMNASREHDKENSLINEVAFNLLRPESRDGIVLQNGDYVVVKLKQINDGKLDSMDKEQRDSLVQQIEASYGMMDYDLYVNSLVKKAQVERK